MKSQRRGQELVKADPAARRAIVILVAGVALGALLIALTDDYRDALTAWVQDNPERAFAWILPAIGVSVVLPVVGIAWYFWRLGARIVREGRFPPANMTWIRTMTVVRGPAARRQGRLLQICAVALLVTIVIFAGILVRLVWNLERALGGRGAL